MGNLSNKYLNKIIAQKLFDGPGDLPDTLEGLNANDYTAVVYNAVIEIIGDLKKSGELKPDQNLDAAGITAQILLETGNGKSSLASKYNNFGGIKAGKYWKGETIMIPNSDGDVNWRVYPTVKKGLEEQVRFFLPSKNPRYFKAGVLSAKNAAEHAKRVQEAGYAGDQKDYADRVIKMANSIQNRLKKANPDYSKGATYTGVSVDNNTPTTTSYQEATGQDFIQQDFQPITIGKPNPAAVFLNDNTKVDLLNVFTDPVEISNPSTKILDNSFYNDNRNKEQIMQSKKNQNFIDSPIKLRTGGYTRKLVNGGSGDPEDPEDPFSTSEISKPTNPINTSKGFFGFLKSAAEYDAARKMSKVELPEQGDLSYDEYLENLNRKQLASIPFKKQMAERDVKLEKDFVEGVQKRMSDIGLERSQHNTPMKEDYDYLGVPFMYNKDSWFHNLKGNRYSDPYSCQGIACAIGRKAGAVNAQDYKTRSAKGKANKPWAIETGSLTVDHADVLAGKGLYPVENIQPGDMVRHGYKSPYGTGHNVIATGKSYINYNDEIEFPAAYASEWQEGVKGSSNYYFDPKTDQAFRYLRNLPRLEKEAAAAESMNEKYQNYLDKKAIASLPIKKAELIRTEPSKIPFIPKKQYPNTRRGRKQEQQDNAYIAAYMARLQKK